MKYHLYSHSDNIKRTRKARPISELREVVQHYTQKYGLMDVRPENYVVPTPSAKPAVIQADNTRYHVLRVRGRLVYGNKTYTKEQAMSLARELAMSTGFSHTWKAI